MDIRRLTPDYAVSPQIAPEDLPAVADQGFKMLINNRPDDEVPQGLQSGAMRTAAEAAGLRYVENPVVNGGMTMDMVDQQGRALSEADGPVLAYCRSGTRSSIVWALSQAGRVPTGELLAAAERAGYDLSGMADQIDDLARR